MTKNRLVDKGEPEGSKSSRDDKPKSMESRSSESGPQHIRNILETVFSEAGLEEQVRLNRALMYWEHIAGPEISPYSRALFVERETLWVEVDNSVRMHKFQMLEGDLKKRMNHEIRKRNDPAGVIRQIRFRLMEND